MEIIKLNLIPNGVNPTCHCSQYDNGRVIRIDLFDGLTPYVLQSGDTVTLNVRKPDNTIVTTSLTATQGNTYVNLVTTEQICACVGYNLCDLTITNGSKVIGTLNFIMAVERDVLADGIPSQSVIEDLDALVEEAVGDNFYNKTETDDLLDAKADKSTTYTKTQVDSALALKANSSDVYTKDQTYNKTEVDSALALKADKATTYTKTETDTALALKADKATTYTKTETDTLLNAKANSSDVVDFQQVNLTIINGKLLNANNGTLSDEPTHQNWQVTDFAEITSTKILISTCHFWSCGMFAFYDENQNFISGQSAAAGGTVTYLYNSLVSVPANAKYIRIGYLDGVQLPNPSLFDGIMGFYNPTQKWNGKKWAVIGDSLTASYAVTDIHYWELIAALTGISCVNMGVSGSGYARGNDNFMTRVLNVPLDSDVVTIFGSGNDGGAGLELGTASDTGTTTLGGVINTTIDNLYSVMPVVKLGIITPTPWVNNMPYNNGFMENYSNLILEICKRRCIPCLDLYHHSNFNPNNADFRQIVYSKDNGGGVHPNEIGHKMLASFFKSFIETLLL